MRTTKETKDELTKLAAGSGVRLSDYVRAVIERRQIVQAPVGSSRDPEVIRQLTAELVREGRNLNDLAKVANSTRQVAQMDEIAVMKERLFRVWEKVLAL